MKEQARQLCESAKAKHLEGRLADAERLYQDALRADPGHIDTLHGLGVLSLQLGRPELAVEHLGKAAEKDGSATLFNNLGVALCQLRRFDDAVEAYRRAVAAEPDAVQTLTNLGYVLNLTGRSGEALACLEKAVALEPDSPEANSHLAAALLLLNRPEEAVPYLEKVAVLAPQRFQSFADLGAALIRCGRYEAAAEELNKAVALRPDFVPALCDLGDALGRLERHEEAAAAFARALAFAPNVAPIHYNLGSALAFLGRIEEAHRAYVRAAALAPAVPAYRYAAITTKNAAEPADLKALESMAVKAEQLPEREQAELFIALAKACDDLKLYERAFEHLKKGNTVKRRLVSYDETAEIGRMRAAAEVFSREFLTAHVGEGDPSQLPVFIVGMPRSGTTLVEQILASHPKVFGAGELTILPDLVAAEPAGENFPAAVDRLTAEDWRRLGGAYVAKLRALSPDKERITDKLPGNFLYTGLIHLMLPQARIVHVRRDALDTCFSCYSKLFDGSVNYAYDLSELGRYWRAYERLMDHWRRALPAAALLELRYEELVGDLEPQVRRLLDFCGLAWDERCFAFHETRRSVRTASAVQVRQPLYASAVGRAAPYAPWLEPLRAALGIAPPEGQPAP